MSEFSPLFTLKHTYQVRTYVYTSIICTQKNDDGPRAGLLVVLKTYHAYIRLLFSGSLRRRAQTSTDHRARRRSFTKKKMYAYYDVLPLLAAVRPPPPSTNPLPPPPRPVIRKKPFSKAERLLDARQILYYEYRQSLSNVRKQTETRFFFSSAHSGTNRKKKNNNIVGHEN